MKLGLISFILTLSAVQAFAEGCGGQNNNFRGVWLDGAGAPTANYTLSLNEFAVGITGCYWIAATPAWGINQDSTEVAKITDTDLDGGVLIAIGRNAEAIQAGQNAWLWIRKDNLSNTSFSEMYFNRQTRGIPR